MRQFRQRAEPRLFTSSRAGSYRQLLRSSLSFQSRSEESCNWLNLRQQEQIVEVLSDTGDKLSTQEFPIIIDSDDDDDSNGFVRPVIKQDSNGQVQISSGEREVGEATPSQRSSSDGGEQDIGENLGQPPNDPEANPEVLDKKLPTDAEPRPTEYQPRKRKCKTKNITVTTGSGVQKEHGPPEKCGAAKLEKCKPGDVMCKIPGCFLRDLEKSKQYSGKNYKQNKDELAERIYTLLNNSVFDNKLPEKIDIVWSNKMLRTAGLCICNNWRTKGRNAKVQIALKVCDSADRLRDTLIHEICHVAAWLLDGAYNSHGVTWKYYARKSNMVHPELPRITRCHSYKINYKIQYECTQCKSRIGRYTKSLDTNRFICAKCKGALVLLPSYRKDGTPIVPHVRPFAKYVKENYKLVKWRHKGMGHGDVMRTLSKDYALKQKEGH